MDIAATHGRTAAAVPPVGEPAEIDSPADDCVHREAAVKVTSNGGALQALGHPASAFDRWARTPTGGNASA